MALREFYAHGRISRRSQESTLREIYPHGGISRVGQETALREIFPNWGFFRIGAREGLHQGGATLFLRPQLQPELILRAADAEVNVRTVIGCTS
jgi:hypothetical protein